MADDTKKAKDNPPPSAKTKAKAKAPEKKRAPGAVKSTKKAPKRPPAPPQPQAIPKAAASVEAALAARKVAIPPNFSVHDWRGFAVFQCQRCRFDTMDPGRAAQHATTHYPRQRVKAAPGRPTKG